MKYYLDINLGILSSGRSSFDNESGIFDVEGGQETSPIS